MKLARKSGSKTHILGVDATGDWEAICGRLGDGWWSWEVDDQTAQRRIAGLCGLCERIAFDSRSCVDCSGSGFLMTRECGRCAGHGVIQGYRFDMESSPIESYREPCPQCSPGPSFWVRCFFGCGFRARDLDPEEAHNHMDAHYEVAHRDALEYLHGAGFIPYGGALIQNQGGPERPEAR